mmetsp:Transcript_8992/g.26539  ORF Transcript_8992/g.26539 Transcript_8992/m.26539 type:complete len:206 (-) Transcript_8992:159-776(-)
MAAGCWPRAASSPAPPPGRGCAGAVMCGSCAVRMAQRHESFLYAARRAQMVSSAAAWSGVGGGLRLTASPTPGDTWASDTPPWIHATIAKCPGRRSSTFSAASAASPPSNAMTPSESSTSTSSACSAGSLWWPWRAASTSAANSADVSKVSCSIRDRVACRARWKPASTAVGFFVYPGFFILVTALRAWDSRMACTACVYVSCAA